MKKMKDWDGENWLVVIVGGAMLLFPATLLLVVLWVLWPPLVFGLVIFGGLLLANGGK